MTNVKAGLVASVIAGLVAGQIALADKTQKTGKMSGTPNAAVFDDIQQTLGFVPQFFRAVPNALLPAFWLSMKTFEMSENTALDAKTKELIGIAVSAQIPCDYCLQFHTEGAKKHGATKQEIAEAVGMAAMTRMGSTVLNGMQVDKTQFRADLQRVMGGGNGKKQKSAQR